MSEAVVQTSPKATEAIDDSFHVATWQDRYMSTFQTLPRESYLWSLLTDDDGIWQKLFEGRISEKFFGNVLWHPVEGRSETDVTTVDLKLSIPESESGSFTVEVKKKSKRLTSKQAYILATDVLKSIEERKMAYTEEEAKYLSGVEED